MPTPNVTGVVSPSSLDLQAGSVAVDPEQEGPEAEEREPVAVELTVALSIGANGILIPLGDIVEIRDSLHDIAVKLGIAP